MSLHIALLNESSLLKGENTAMRIMIDAVVLAINEDFAPAWNLLPVTGAFYEDKRSVPKNGTIFKWVNKDPDVPGADGYHTLENDVAYARMLADPILQSGAGILDVGKTKSSCAGTFCHEAFELLVNPRVNLWAEMPNGDMLALETGDPAQDIVNLKTMRDGTVVSLCDGTLPAYFSDQGKGRLTLLDTIKSPFGMTDGGYQIIKDGKTGRVKNVWGKEVPEWQKEAKLDASRKGRTYRYLSRSE